MVAATANILRFMVISIATCLARHVSQLRTSTHDFLEGKGGGRWISESGMHRCCVRLYSVGLGVMLVDQMLVCGSITTITNLLLYNLLSSVDVLGVQIAG
jgi:hypothetical protein